ncbi:hypothetical protein BD779DRAFT_1629001 [Infundibulicybe gibba]|nr:hypothetical protein BD779DRAFT_1629001 [Infundibulicybe gibba]
MLVPSSFTTSVLPVQENVVKNIIFRVSALCLQLAVYNLCSYCAFKSKAYTSFLMFAEDYIQRLFFISSRGWSRSALIVLGFAILSPLAGLYDTLLWSLDSPGYVIKSSRVNGSAVDDQLLTTPPYIVFIANSAGNVNSIDADAAITGNLFKSGFNFTFPPMNDLSRGDIVPARQSLADAGGPRIWLDDEGFSVGIDSFSPINPHCSLQTTDDRNQAWGCHIPNNESYGMFSEPLGQPFIWWDGNQSEYMRSFRNDNPWKSLGTGGDTAAMKQVFTVTKDRRRHTFLETVLKVSMISMSPVLLDDADILEMVRRTFSDDPANNIQPSTKNLADIIVAAQANHSSFSGGTFLQQDYSVGATSIELLNITNSADQSPIYVAFRVTSTNITLIRSETLPNPVTPLSPCPLYFSNLATGGRLRSTTCYLSTATQGPGARFLGQLDASAVLILSDVLGDGSTAKAATALNETGLLWYQNHTEHIDQVLASRAFILGGDRESVMVDVQHAAPALSYLQLLLSLIPTLVALVSILLIRRDKRGYFQSSFFVAVHATTHLDESRCDKVGYSHVPPEIRLDVVDGHVLLGTPNGGTLGIISLGSVDPPTPSEKDTDFVNQDSYHTVPTMEGL